MLEHIGDDEAAIRHCFRMLKSGGIVVIEVPAGPGLFDDYDRELMHFRRYSAAELRRKVEASGFAVAEQSFIGCLIYPAFWTSKKWSRLQGGKGSATKEQSRVRTAIRATAKANRAGRWLMKVEASLSRKVDLPFGIRSVIVGRKP